MSKVTRLKVQWAPRCHLLAPALSCQAVIQPDGVCGVPSSPTSASKKSALSSKRQTKTEQNKTTLQTNSTPLTHTHLYICISRSRTSTISYCPTQQLNKLLQSSGKHIHRLNISDVNLRANKNCLYTMLNTCSFQKGP